MSMMNWNERVVGGGGDRGEEKRKEKEKVRREAVDVADFESGEAEKKSGRGFFRSRKKTFLTPRDQRFLKLCFEQHFLTRSQTISWLEDFECVSQRNTRMSSAFRLTEFLVRNGFLERCFFPISELSNAFNVTRKGVRFLRTIGGIPETAEYVVSDSSKFVHDYFVTQVRFVWEKYIRIKEWVPDRVLKAERGNSVSDAEFSFFSKKANRDIRVALEIELTQKNKERYVKKIQDYHNSPYDMVIFFLQNNNLSKKIVEISRNISPKIFVCSLDELISKKGETEIVSYQSRIIINRGFYVADA